MCAALQCYHDHVDINYLLSKCCQIPTCVFMVGFMQNAAIGGFTKLTVIRLGGRNLGKSLCTGWRCVCIFKSLNKKAWGYASTHIYINIYITNFKELLHNFSRKTLVLFQKKWRPHHRAVFLIFISRHTLKMLVLPFLIFNLCEKLTHWERPWCWEGLGAGGEGDERGWDGWMASPTRWTWVWVNSGSWWWTGRPGVLWLMGSQRVGHDWATELNWWDNTDAFAHFNLWQDRVSCMALHHAHF